MNNALVDLVMIWVELKEAQKEEHLDLFNATCTAIGFGKLFKLKPVEVKAAPIKAAPTKTTKKK